MEQKTDIKNAQEFLNETLPEGELLTVYNVPKIMQDYADLSIELYQKATPPQKQTTPPSLSLEECKDKVAQRHGRKKWAEGAAQFNYNASQNFVVDYWQEVAQLYAQQPGREWIKCEDRLPEEQGFYLGCLGGTDQNVFYFDFDEGETPFKLYNLGKGTWDDMIVTHWMPLPEPPKP